MSVACGSCRRGMESLTLDSHLGAALTIDVCWPCHVIWFDHLESSALSPGAVIELFRKIHAAREVERQTLALHMGCPHCASSLKATSDLTRGGRFSYFRCASGHGRLISFAQFLREKQFVRTLLPHEIQKVALTVKQVRCSSCGGPIDLVKDSACTHCGSAIAVLDEAAVQRALDTLATREFDRTHVDPAKLADALIDLEADKRRARVAAQKNGWTEQRSNGTLLADLLDFSIDAIPGLFNR